MGRVIEVVTGQSYEDAVRALLIDPLGLDQTRFFTDELAGYPVAGPHAVVVDDRAVFAPDLWYFPRSGHPFGGLVSSARDQLRYARFHLGDGRAPDGTPLLSPASLAAMRSNPGPGGTLGAEIDGYGISLCLRRTAEGIHVVEHGGDRTGQHSSWLFVPERDFAMTLLTNSMGGGRLRVELCYGDWTLQQFAALHNPPAVPTRVSAARLAEYEGTYVARILGPPEIGEPSIWGSTTISMQASDGALRAQTEGEDQLSEQRWAFYRGEYVVAQGDEADPPARANFVRGPDGRVAWFSSGGRLYVRQG
jgi:CubicO group peptidase (beta-lactamase class C family)